MTCLSKEEIKTIKEQKSDIIEGVRLLIDVIEEEQVEYSGLFLVHYEPDPVTGEIMIMQRGAYSNTELATILSSLMAKDKGLRAAIMGSVKMYKSMAHG
jgi:hypothetical protein